MTIARLAYFLGVSLDRNVVDSAGIAGEFDIQLTGRIPPESRRTTLSEAEIARVFPNSAGARDDESPTIFSAIRQLGLRIESAKLPVEYLIVESADEIPTSN